MKSSFNFVEIDEPNRPRWTFFLVLAALSLALAGPSAAQDASLDDLRRQVAALQAEVTRMKAEGGGSVRMQELERRIDLLAAEIEKTRTGEAAQSKPLEGAFGFAPAASKVYGIARGVSIGGYGEIVYQGFGERRQDGAPSGQVDRLDFLRNVVYVGYKFSDKILFNSELEFEHATTGEGAEERGEASVEFGYLEFRPWKSVGVRAGLVLIPLGFLNELHEAPIFHGAERPELERQIIPTTWRENGVGLFGENGPLQWRAYAVAGLASEGFEGSGIREGRQGGSNSKARDLAFTGRLDFTGVRGLVAGAALFAGNAGQGAGFAGRTTLADLHAQYERKGLQLRALAVWSRIGDAARINLQNGLVGDESVGERQSGWSLQAAYDVLASSSGGGWSVTPFVRYERLDTQGRVPAGFARDRANDQTVFTAGIGVKPITHVVLKADFQRFTNEARTGTNRINLGVGYLF